MDGIRVRCFQRNLAQLYISYQILSVQIFFSKVWKGSINSKKNILQIARFSIVYENVQGLTGYITEKIFDAFNCGNVPVYWGASNVSQCIPSSCFIDRRDFSSHANLYKYLKYMPESQFIDYQKAIAGFLISEMSVRFSNKHFSSIICQNIIKTQLDLS
jgi:hypothetical protein